MIATPVGTSLLLTLLIDFSVQLVFYLVSAALRTEVLYDLSGALTYASCILVALLYRQDGAPISALHARQILVASLVLAWCSRLGGFLFLRVLRTPDKRFDSLKTSFVKFSVPWVLQVVWIFLTAFAAFVVVGNPSSSQIPLQWSDYLGLAIWAFGFAVEATADYQKYVFKNKFPKEFVRTGVWAWSRYANYNGEITLWIGMFALCAAGFAEPWQWVTVVSPLFVAALILGVSGVPLLEKSAEERYGKNLEYIAYKARTSKFFLWPPKRLPAPAEPAAAPAAPNRHESVASTEPMLSGEQAV